MRFRYQLLFIVFGLWVLTAQAAKAPTILVVGDSLSAAYGMELAESWPSLLQERLSENGYAWRVFNSSVAGDTTQGGLSRLPGLLAEQQPGMVIIELGGNDGLRGLPLDVTRRNLAKMIEQARTAGARVLLTEMRIPPNYGRSYTEQFNGTYHDLAEMPGVTLVPFLLEDIALKPDLMQEDGIHPTAQAQPLILDKVWSVLEPVLDKSAASGR
ncbi:MAG: arylesterase [Lysobacterales bacterium]|jgi:acyl-CoA thioesterase-1